MTLQPPQSQTLPSRPPNFQQVRRVRWCETDGSGAVHFANYVRYMEETEYAFLRSLGLCVVLTDERGTLGFPRIRCQIQIAASLQFDDHFLVELFLTENNGKRIQYDFALSRISDPAAVPCRESASTPAEATASPRPAIEDKDLVATGRFQVACCRFPADAPPFAILVPHDVLEKLERAAV